MHFCCHFQVWAKVLKIPTGARVEFSALQQNIVVNWVIEAAFLRAATRKKRVKGVQKPRGFAYLSTLFPRCLRVMRTEY